MRQKLRRRRQALSWRERRIATRALTRQLLRNPRVRRARHIAIYQAYGSELSLQDFALAARQAGKRLYLPRLGGNRMRFIDADAPLHRNRLGILEPRHGKPRPPWAMQVMLVPLVGIDRHGNRLGQGGGYYDRCLAQLRFRRPWLIGIAHDCQIVDALQPAPWDVPMDAAITPRQQLQFRTTA